MAEEDDEEYDDEEYVDEEEYYDGEENNGKDETKYGTIKFIAILAFSMLIFLFIVYPDFLIKPQGGVVAGYMFTMPGIVWLIFPIVAILYLSYKLEK